MCLERITRKPKSTSGWGYKVFALCGDGRLLGECMGKGVARPRGKWIRASDYGSVQFWYGPNGPRRLSLRWISEPPGPKYRAGWHIFPSLKDARLWAGERIFGSPPRAIVRVRYRWAHTRGTQRYRGRDLRVIVAREIFIPLDKKGA